MSSKQYNYSKSYASLKKKNDDKTIFKDFRVPKNPINSTRLKNNQLILPWYFHPEVSEKTTSD